MLTAQKFILHSDHVEKHCQLVGSVSNFTKTKQDKETKNHLANPVKDV